MTMAIAHAPIAQEFMIITKFGQLVVAVLTLFNRAVRARSSDADKERVTVDRSSGGDDPTVGILCPLPVLATELRRSMPHPLRLRVNVRTCTCVETTDQRTATSMQQSWAGTAQHSHKKSVCALATDLRLLHECCSGARDRARSRADPMQKSLNWMINSTSVKLKLLLHICTRPAAAHTGTSTEEGATRAKQGSLARGSSSFLHQGRLPGGLSPAATSVIFSGVEIKSLRGILWLCKLTLPECSRCTAQPSK
jgi:hypothetical protein